MPVGGAFDVGDKDVTGRGCDDGPMEGEVIAT
jgi:hypothetical protein